MPKRYLIFLISVALTMFMDFPVLAQNISGKWEAAYSEERDLYDMDLVNEFVFGTDGTFFQTALCSPLFHGKDHGTCKITVTSVGKWTVSGNKLTLVPDPEKVEIVLSDMKMSKSLEHIFRTTVYNRMMKRYSSPRTSTISGLTPASMTLTADDKRSATYSRK